FIARCCESFETKKIDSWGPACRIKDLPTSSLARRPPSTFCSIDDKTTSTLRRSSVSYERRADAYGAGAPRTVQLSASTTSTAGHHLPSVDTETTSMLHQFRPQARAAHNRSESIEQVEYTCVSDRFATLPAETKLMARRQNKTTPKTFQQRQTEKRLADDKDRAVVED